MGGIASSVLLGVWLGITLQADDGVRFPGRAELLAAVDGDGDGTTDLVVGRSGPEGRFLVVYSGNVDAIFPDTPQARQRRIEGGRDTAPFLNPPRIVPLTEWPEWLAAGGTDTTLLIRLNEDAVPDAVWLDDEGTPLIALSESAATITVDVATDDAIPGDGRCTLREAIGNANGNNDTTAGDCAAGSGTDTIVFDIGGGGFAVTIDVGSALPFVSDPVTINGNTQSCPTPPCIDLNGIPSLGADGLRLTGGGNSVRGLVIRGFDEQGIAVESDGNIIEGNHIGTDLGGTIPFPNSMAGVFVTASDNIIGGTVAAASNLISANTDGVNIQSGSGNVVAGNRIGTDAAGTGSLENAVWGVFAGGSDNTIGGSAAGAGNVVSGNGFAGIGINGSAATGNVVAGNLIGLDITGTVSVPNDLSGLILTNGAAGNTIGGASPGARNVISGNVELGIAVGTGATLNLIQGNYVGTDASGSVAVGNGFSGILLQDAPANTIGGTAAGAGNLISGNGRNGVFLVDTNGPLSGNDVIGNRIGLDASGEENLPNALNGIRILDSANHRIGGATAAAGNVIAGSVRHGVEISGVEATGNELSGNRIVGNGRHGVAVVLGAAGNAILGNAIDGNGLLGIDLAADGVTGNDPGDVDGGPNGLQNYPELTSADATASGVTVSGTLSSQAGSTYRIEFFAGPGCDPSGHGEGGRFLGSALVSTGVGGSVGVSEALSASVADGESITATATAPDDNTSEFSACVTAACLEAVPFGQTVLAQDPDSMIWPVPADVRFVVGMLTEVSIYGTFADGLLLETDRLEISADLPRSGAGYYYLIEPLGCGSWQTAPGEEPDRDLLLP